MVRTPPKFVCTRTPTVYPPMLAGRRRDEVPMPPFHPKTTVPVPAPTAPSSTGPPFAFLTAANTSSGGEVTAANVAQISVVGFADHRIDGQHILVARQRQHVTDHRIRHARYAGGGRQQDRCFDVAHFVNLSGTRQLSETIAHKNRTRHFLAIEIAGVGQYGGHAGADVIAPNDGRLPDFDAGNIGDRIQRPGRQDADLQPQIRGAGTCIGSCALGSGKYCRQQDRRAGKKLPGHGNSIRPNSGLLAPPWVGRLSGDHERIALLLMVPKTTLKEGPFISFRRTSVGRAYERA